MISTHSRHFIYTHWLKMDTLNELIQWQKLKDFKDKYDCSMTVYYYDYNPLTDKVIKLDCNQSYQDLKLDVNSMANGSFKRIKAKPKNITAYNKGINYFFAQNLGITIQEEINPVKKIYDKTEFIQVDVLKEFSHLKNIKEFDKIMKKENWQIVKIKSERGYHYQLYFGEGKQVDNRYEFAFAEFTYKSRMEDRLKRFINNKLKQLDVDIGKFIGLKVNSFESIHEISYGENISVDIKCIGLVLGIQGGYIELYDFQRPLGEQFYSIKIEEFKKLVIDGIYKENYNQLADYEKLELRRYLNNRLNKLQQICGDWNYRNIDMTESHLQGITIKGDVIGITCEKYSTNLDDYVSCSGGDIKSKELVKEFNLLDLEDKVAVLEYISKIECYINYKEVNERLSNLEEKELNDLNNNDMEMELEYE